MGSARKQKINLDDFTPMELDRLVRMGWEDRTTFEAIRAQFNISPNGFVKIMRQLLTPDDFKRWRRRVSEQGKLKNEAKRGFKKTRFKSTRQSVDGITKGWK